MNATPIQTAAIIAALVAGMAMADDKPVTTGSIEGTVAIDASGALVTPSLARAAVYLSSAPALDGRLAVDSGAEATAEQIAARPRIGQRNKAFVPDFLIVQLGTWVEFPNWDEFSHNVFSRSAAAPPFDLDRYPFGQSKAYQFTKVGVVQVFCNIHPQMRATVVVTPNRYSAAVSAEGRFTIADVPAGTYEVVVWHGRCDEQKQTVQVKAGEAATVKAELKLNVSQALSGTPKHRPGTGVLRGLGVKRETLNLPVVEQSHPACCPDPAGKAPDHETAD